MLAEFVRNTCVGGAFDSCVDSPCPYSSSGGCMHPLHPSNLVEKFTGDDNVNTVQPIDQVLIEVVEQNAQEALAAWLQEVKAPAWVMDIITGLRLLDQFEGQTDNLYGVPGHNAEMAGILNDLIKATWVHAEQMKIEADTITRD